MKRARKARNLARRFHGYVPAVREFRDPEDVHQMRVAGRTLLAYIDYTAGRKGRKQPEVRHARKSVKGYMRLLGGLRDLDVLIEELRNRMAFCNPQELALLARWVRDTEEERAAERKRAAAALRGLGKRKFARALKGWEEWLAEESGGKPAKRIKKLRAEAEGELEAIVARDSYPIGDEAFLDQVHMARISVKKLRYALANAGAGGAENDDSTEEIERLKVIQDRLGRAHDLRIWIARLEKYRELFQGPVEDLTIGMREEMLAAIESGIDAYKMSQKQPQKQPGKQQQKQPQKQPGKQQQKQPQKQPQKI